MLAYLNADMSFAKLIGNKINAAIGSDSYMPKILVSTYSAKSAEVLSCTQMYLKN